MAFIKPKVYEDIVTAKFNGRIVFANLATDLGALSGSVGETVSFPKFSKIGDATDFTKGTAIAGAELEQVESTATIKCKVAPGVYVYDTENLTALGNQVDEGAVQQGKVLARAIDSDIATNCDGTTLKVATAKGNEITANELNQGFIKFGDEQDTEDIAGIVINSLLANSFYSMPEFVDATKTYNGQNGNGIVQNGIIGHFRGIPVMMTDRGTVEGNGASLECKTYIVKKGALGRMMKRGINVEIERQASYKRHGIYSDVIYATKLLDDEGVVLLRKTIATA